MLHHAHSLRKRQSPHQTGQCDSKTAVETACSQDDRCNVFCAILAASVCDPFFQKFRTCKDRFSAKTDASTKSTNVHTVYIASKIGHGVVGVLSVSRNRVATACNA